MSQIIEVNEEGALYLPPELLAKLLGNARPHTQYILEAQDGNLILTRLKEAQSLWSTASPQERAKAFHNWATSHKDSPGLPDASLRREAIYD